MSYIAVISDGVKSTFCIYGTESGLFYNKHDQMGRIVSKPTELLSDEVVEGIFRQNDYLFVVTGGPKLYSVSLTEQGPAVNLVFRQQRDHRMFGVHSKFIGGYYDSKKDQLILASSNAMISVFKNNGTINHRFDRKFQKWRSRTFGRRSQTGNAMYYDDKRDQAVYISNKYVIRVNMDPNAVESNFAELLDTKSWLNIEYDCHNFIYIYHQNTLVTLQRLHASATRPFVLRIHTSMHLK